MEETPADPLDISKEQDLIKDAQKELSKIDVLVCGGCHEVFHFVEEFQKHKTSNECTNISVLKCENEEKSQIWGFTLWKVKQMKTCKSKGEVLPTSWEIYQKWTKLNQIEKDLWISAGRMLQYTHKAATGKIQVVREEKKVEKDPLAIDDDVTLENEVSNTNNCNKADILKNITIIQGSKKGLRTTKDNEKGEYNVEKIVGKKFNPRKRLWEYEVKWENYQEPTWEPLAHLENCKALVQEFEDKLKAEKELKEKDKPPGRGRGRPRLNPQSPGGVKIVQKKPSLPPSSAILMTTPGGRPQRSSKQRALNQVKAWCGNISDEEGGLKRPFEDDDGESDDSFEKKMKLEGDSEDTEEDEPKTPVRKVAKLIHTYNNGTGKKLPDNVLIPDAKGVVRISQKQLPSLSSGVYIMSKSSGIIKLDPTASKIATSGGQAIVKVSPKIGQTQIKIIKKEDGSKRVVQVKGPEVTTATTTTATITPSLTPIAPRPKIMQQVVNRTTIVKKEVKKVETPKVVQPVKVVEKEKKDEVKLPPLVRDDDSDDGIPELEFPTDLPLPQPESPPGEFTLDPFTGKVVGIDYPEIEEVVEEKKEVAKSLDNIVKLAAADITEEDLKPDAEVASVTASPVTTSTAVTVTTVTTAAATVNPPKPPTVTSKTPVAVAVVATTAPKTAQSILSTAMANSNILQKTLQSPTARPKTQPRIINQSVARPRSAIGQVVRTPSQPRPAPGPPRPRPQVLPKPKFNISPMSPVKNVYSAKTNNVAKKSAHAPVHKPKPTPTTPQLLKKSAPKPATSAPKPKPPISMPTLDEEPAAAAATATLVLAPKVAQVVNEVPTVEADLSTFTLATTDRPMFITGDDGTVYQVAGQNEEGQTILVTQDSDGQQQCLLVTSEAIQEEVEQGENQGQVMMEVQEPAEVAEEQPLVAQFIRTEPPSPGGTHKVVVMLPDGDVMVTQVTPEEYASLELDK